ncbi:MAG: type II secretion system secretin GspD, partial [Myxococcales bacterium]|nr:type II secretion system secretin GspD [Myxococcales bacterium]
AQATAPIRVRPQAPAAPPAAIPVQPNAGPTFTPGATPGAAPGAAGGAEGAGRGPTLGPGGKPIGDTQTLQQFEPGVEYAPRNEADKVSFSLEDADLAELVRVIGELTGKRFIFGGKIRSIKATVFSPQKVTVAEAYQAFLSILEANGLTVVPHGRFYKIVESPDAKTGAPVYVAGQAATPEDRFITRIHRLHHVSAEDVANVLGHFKSKDGDITVYGPGNLLIITDTGTNIQRMMHILEDVDVGGVGDQIWIEPVHYGMASDIQQRLDEVFDLKNQAAQAAKAPPGSPASAASDLHIAKILADDRSNSLVIISTERAYLRVLEFIKRLDVPVRTGEGEIHVLELQHADAVELAKTLNEIVTGATAAAQGGGAPGKPNAGLAIFESGVRVSADKATNSIVITSSLRDFANLRTVIDRLDQPRRQVFIEAVIMDLTINRQNQLGMAFHTGAIANDVIQGGTTTIFGGLNPFRTIALPSPTDTTLNAFALGIRGPGIPGTENLLGTGISIPAFGVLINALASTNDSDILSTPHILATDNIPAEINVGQNIPLQSNFGGIGSLPGIGAAGGAATSALGALGGLGGFGFGGTAPRQDIGTKIKIVPHLNDSDEVRLEVTEEISDTAGLPPVGTLGAQPFSKRTAQTQLVVKDQQTVVIGGLVRNHIARTDTKIPLLGDIPVLGALFRSSQNTLEKTNLVLVLTPYIIREQADLRTVFERKMQERQEFLDHYFVFSDQTDYEAPKDYSRMNGLLEEIRQSYMDLDEQRRFEEVLRPREMKTHTAGQPLELPTTVGPRLAPAGPAGAPPPAAPAPNAPASPGAPGGAPAPSTPATPGTTPGAAIVPVLPVPPGVTPPVNTPPPGAAPAPPGSPTPPASGAPATPGAPPAPTPGQGVPPTINVAPPARNLDRMER